MSDSTTQSVLFPSLFSKPVHVAFDEVAMSSDGGGLLLKAVDDELGLTEAMASCLRDGRQAGKVKHSLQETLRSGFSGSRWGIPMPMMRMHSRMTRSTSS